MNSEKFFIDKTPLGQKAASIIRHRIIEGVYPQGSRLIEEKLANEFNISRSCVREAFLILETEGMVKSERNKYTKVLKLKQKEIEDLFLFRMALELLSIEICINKNSAPLEKMDYLVKKLDDMINNRTINSFEYVEADLNFHETIVVSSQNMYIINTYKSIKYQLMTLLFFLYNKFKDEFSAQGMGQHYKITEFIKKGDIGSAQDFLKTHIYENLEYVTKLNSRAEAMKP